MFVFVGITYLNFKDLKQFDTRRHSSIVYAHLSLPWIAWKCYRPFQLKFPLPRKGRESPWKCHLRHGMIFHANSITCHGSDRNFYGRNVISMENIISFFNGKHIACNHFIEVSCMASCVTFNME